MKLILRNILLLALASAVWAGCVREDELLGGKPEGTSPGVNDEREPADLVFTIQMDDLNAAFEQGGPATRSAAHPRFGSWISETKLKDDPYTSGRWDANSSGATVWDANTLDVKKERHDKCDARSNDSKIYSLAFFLIDMQLNVDGTRPPTWGRIVAYRLFLPGGNFFHDADEILGLPFPDVPLVHEDMAGNSYDYGDDFNYSKDSGGGLNGFARMTGMDENGYGGTLVPDDAANAGGYGGGFYEFDFEGSQKSSDAVIMTFKYDDPMHPTRNNLEKLRRGDTWVMAIANFHEVSTTFKGHPIGWYIKEVIDYWQRHKDDPDFYGIPANQIAESGYKYVLMQANPVTGAAEEELIEDKFMGFRFFADAALRQSDSDFISRDASGVSGKYDDDYTNDDIGRLKENSQASLIRHYRPIILASHDWRGALTQGENVFKLQLKRMAQRMTFSISNHSESPLTVSGLKLSENFAQAAAWVFPHDRTPLQLQMLGNYFENWQGSPDVYSNKAAVPFRKRTYPRMDHHEVFFECLSYESKDMTGHTPMTYDITLEYEGISREVTTRTADVSGSSTSYNTFRSDLSNNRWQTGTTRYYVLQNQKASYGKRFIRKDERSNAVRGVEGSSLDIVTEAVRDDADYFYVWGIEKVSTTTVKIKNLGSRDMYLKKPSSTTGGNDAAAFTFTENSSEAAIFSIAQASGYTGLYFYTQVDGSNAFPHMLNSGSVVCIYTYNDAGAHFVPYRVTVTDRTETVPLRKELKNIPLKVFDYESGMAGQLHEIKRNDQIRAHIDVTYNPESQDIEFEVRDWDKSDNDLTFD